MKHIKSIKESLSFEGYTFDEILDKVISGDIKIDLKGHSGKHLAKKDDMMFTHPPMNYFKREKSTQDHSKSYRIERMGGDNAPSQSLMDFYKAEDEKKYLPGMTINRLSMDYFHCSDCGKRMRPVLTSPTTVAFVDWQDIEEISGNRHTDFIDVEKIPSCEALKITDKTVTEITLETGHVVFTDKFRTESLDIDGELNNLLGRIQVEKDSAKMNVGMGTMTNTSVGVYKKRSMDGDCYEIVIADNEVFRKGLSYKKIGDISCGVWRWMCADISVCKEHGEKLPEFEKEGNASVEYDEYTYVIVKPGVWVIEHYFDIVGDRPDGIYSKLYFKQ